MTPKTHDTWRLIVGKEHLTTQIKKMPTPYACLIWAVEPTTSAFKQTLAASLIGSGCRYIVAGGAECEAWHDECDEAYLASDENFSPPPKTMVMTTWHEGESIGEVIHFLVHAAVMEDVQFGPPLIIQVGHADQVGATLRMAMASHAQ